MEYLWHLVNPEDFPDEMPTDKEYLIEVVNIEETPFGDIVYNIKYVGIQQDKGEI